MSAFLNGANSRNHSDGHIGLPTKPALELCTRSSDTLTSIDGGSWANPEASDAAQKGAKWIKNAKHIIL